MQSQITTLTPEQIKYKTTLSNPIYGGRATCGCDLWISYGRCRHINEMKAQAKGVSK